MKIILSLILTILTISFVKSQNSPSNCTYNGIDYSFLYLNNSSYSAYSTTGQYLHYWNICGDYAKVCNIGIASCSLDLAKTYTYGNPMYQTGASFLGSFLKNSNNDTVLNYKTNFFPCDGGKYRDFNIILKCGTGPITISKVAENSCTYTVTMEGSSLCPGQTPTQAPTQAPTQTPTPTETPSPTQKVICKLSDNGLIVNSTYSISCSSTGPIQCYTHTDTLLIESPTTIVKYSTSSGSVSCIGKNIECSSSYATCSIDLSSSSSSYELPTDGSYYN